ncbi:cytidine deaminase [Thraustotheca clavata]|uniref:Cytidine deaminase n=1 Tax=Thraustotheca clavata TaxID=74557 RepID=A0A1V9ZB16_9STRA|nr:cytidine deaminase [Thraustotheca clavata]
MESINWDELELAAKEASKLAYAPYSKFNVGAALLTSDGKVFAGCNVENAAYPLGNCAERTAIFTARVQSNMEHIEAICIYTPTEKATSPCGACRQVLNEFGPTMVVRMICDSDEVLETTLDQLLPYGFGPKNLLDAQKP